MFALAPTKVPISVALSATESSGVSRKNCSTRTGAREPRELVYQRVQRRNDVGQVGPEGGLDADGDHCMLGRTGV